MTFLSLLLGRRAGSRVGLLWSTLGETADLQLGDPSWTGVPAPLEQPGRESDLTWGADGTGEL